MLQLSEVVGPENVMEVVARWTGVPVTKLNQTQKERLLGRLTLVSSAVMLLGEACLNLML